jgi:pimeloyl-ACP methyl ester carboxylesterase
MSAILVMGPNKFLGIHIVRGLLAGTDDHITWSIENLDSSVEEELRELCGGNPALKEAAKSRLELKEQAKLQENEARADEVWFLDAKPELPPLPGVEEQEQLASTLHIIAGSGALTLNYAGSIYSCCGKTGALPEPSSRELQITGFCQAHGIRSRVFMTSWLMGEDHIATGSGDDVHGLLHAVDEVIAEIQERTPEYFDFQALRIHAAKDAAVNVVSVSAAAEIMLNAAKRTGSKLPQCIVSAEDVLWQDFCELLGEVYGVSILCVDDPEELNAIDHLLGERLAELQSGWSGKSVRQFHASDSREDLELDRDAQLECLNAARSKQERARKARDQKTAGFPNSWRKKAIPRPEQDLTYYMAGSEGEYILILNALGQPLDAWYRLVNELMRRNRVILWETRGLASEQQQLRLSDHVDDIEAILREEQIVSCHLVAWCTGPQAAVEFYMRHPNAVQDMVFLNCTIKVADHPELETAIGKNLESLCQAIIRNPKMTDSIRKSLSVPLPSEIDMDGLDSKNLAKQVLLLANVHLRNCVLVPFQTETSTFNYARQILDLTTYPTLEYASRVEAPILVIGCECDQVAGAAKSSIVAGMFPNTRHVELPGATHYSFYDRPRLVYGMMQSFFHEQRSVAAQDPVEAAAGR